MALAIGPLAPSFQNPLTQPPLRQRSQPWAMNGRELIARELEQEEIPRERHLRCKGDATHELAENAHLGRR
jgi:hypothetical protein